MIVNLDPASREAVREPVRVVPLGYLTPSGARNVLTIGERYGAPKHEYTVSHEFAAFLDAIDVRVVRSDLTTYEEEVLRAMHDSDIVAVCPVSEGLPVIPVTRKPLTLAEHTAAGYLLQIGDSEEEAVVSEVGGQLMRMIDGDRTLQDLVDELAQHDPGYGRILLEEAAAFAQSMRRTGALTFEPVG